MFCCNRLTPLKVGQSCVLDEESIQKHGIDMKTKTSILAVYSDSAFQIERTFALISRVAEAPPLSLRQKISKGCWHWLFTPPLQDEKVEYCFVERWTVTRVKKN